MTKKTLLPMLAASFVCSFACPTNVLAKSKVEVGVNSGFHAGLGGLVGASLGMKSFYNFGRVYSLGLSFAHTWIVPPKKSDEFGVIRHDLMIVNRFKVVSKRRTELALDLGVGITRNQGEVDIPLQQGCFGCGRYGGTTYQPAAQLGAVLSVSLTKHLYFQAGAQLVAAAFFINSATDMHNFTPSPLALGLDAGIVARF